jgi:hypothetical protein
MMRFLIGVITWTARWLREFSLPSQKGSMAHDKVVCRLFLAEFDPSVYVTP